MNAEKTGNLIYEIRTRKNLTQKELAEKINVSDKAVSKWERGEGCPDVSILPALSEVLGIEVDSIINGKIPESQNISGKTIKVYDFTQPDRYSRSMQRDIAILGNAICQKMNSEFTAMLNDRFESHVDLVDQMVNVEFLRSLPQECFFFDFDYKNRGLCIVIDGELGKSILKQDYRKYNLINQYDLDVFRDFQLKKISEGLSEQICSRTEKRILPEAFGLSKVKAFGNPNSSPQEDNVMMLLLRIECSAGEVHGYINIQFSENLLEDMKTAGFFSESASSQIKFQELSSIKNKQLPVNILVEFGRYNPDDVELEEGKILILDKKRNEGLNIVHENRVIHTGKTVAIDENWGMEVLESVQLNDIVYDEEDYISVQLGTASLSEEEISTLHQGSYIVLKQRAGELCHIIRSGKTIGLGEMCIADDFFAIRIVEVK